MIDQPAAEFHGRCRRLSCSCRTRACGCAGASCGRCYLGRYYITLTILDLKDNIPLRRFPILDWLSVVRGRGHRVGWNLDQDYRVVPVGVRSYRSVGSADARLERGVQLVAVNHIPILVASQLDPVSDDRSQPSVKKRRAYRATVRSRINFSRMHIDWKSRKSRISCSLEVLNIGVYNVMGPGPHLRYHSPTSKEHIQVVFDPRLLCCVPETPSAKDTPA